MEINNKAKGKNIYKVLSIIFTILGVCLFAICFSLALTIFKNYENYTNPETNNLNTGLSIAFALILYIVFGAPNILVLTLAIIFSNLARRRNSKLGKILLTTNIVVSTLLIIFFIIIIILLKVAN